MSVLCVIVDCNACAWASLFEQQNQLAETANLLSVSISSIVSFCSAHLAQNCMNRLVLFAAAVGVSSQPLYSDLMTSDDARRTMAIGLRSAFNASANSTNVEMGIPLASMVALSLCHIARVRNECPNADARVLVLTVSEEANGDEKRLMNLFFTAHKQQIIVDVAAIGSGNGFALLQQAADITGGIHVSMNSPRSLLNHLLTFFLCDSRVRRQLTIPEPDSVDYRTTCYCHGNSVSVAFACSVCLAVHCHITPICDSCGSVFKIDFTRLQRKRKRPTA